MGANPYISRKFNELCPQVKFSAGFQDTYECIFYDSNGTVIKHEKNHESARVIPGSQGEKFIRTIASYCKQEKIRLLLRLFTLKEISL